MGRSAFMVMLGMPSKFGLGAEIDYFPETQHFQRTLLLRSDSHRIMAC